MTNNPTLTTTLPEGEDQVPFVNKLPEVIRDHTGVLRGPKGNVVKNHDWKAIELDYRMGLLSTKDIAYKYGMTKKYLQTTIDDLGWKKDILAIANKRSEKMVNEEVARINSINPNALEEVAGKMTDFVQTIKFNQRADVRRARDIVMRMFEELDELSAPSVRRAFEELDEAINRESPSTVRMKYQEISSLPKRVEMVNKLSVALKTMVQLERQVYEMDIEDQVKDDSLSTLIVNVANNMGASLNPNSKDSITRVEVTKAPQRGGQSMSMQNQNTMPTYTSNQTISKQDTIDIFSDEPIDHIPSDEEDF